MNKLEKPGKRVLLLIWDNASWHTSREVQEWIKGGNHRVRQEGRGVLIVISLLPTRPEVPG